MSIREQPAPRRFPRSTVAIDATAPAWPIVVGWAPALMGWAPQPLGYLVWVPIVVWFG